MIDKLSGRIIRRETIPQGPDKNSVNGPSPSGWISRERAIEIARTDADLRYGPKGENVDRFAVFACELTRSWRVVFDLRIESSAVPKNFPNAAFPKYVIDKRTGNIIYRELN